MKRILLAFGVLLLASMACNFNMGKSTGGEVHMDASGFSAVVPAGYEIASIFGELSCTKEGVEISEGPHFSVSLGAADQVYTSPEAILENMEGANNVFNYAYSGERTPITVGDGAGLAEDFTGVSDKTGEALAGRVIVAVLPDGRQLRVTGYWPPEMQSEAEPALKALLDSLKFYDPIQPTESS